MKYNPLIRFCNKNCHLPSEKEIDSDCRKKAGKLKFYYYNTPDYEIHTD